MTKKIEWGTKYLLTINKPTLTALLMTIHEVLTYTDYSGWKVSVEVGEKGNLHAHIYTVFKRSVRFDTLLNKFKVHGMDVKKVTVGTEATVLDYVGNTDKETAKGCTILNEYTTIWGNVESTQGTRNDLNETDRSLWEIKEAIDSGVAKREIWNMYFPYMVRYGRGVCDYIEMVAQDKGRTAVIETETYREHLEQVRIQAEIDARTKEAENLAAEKILLNRIYNELDIKERFRTSSIQ